MSTRARAMSMVRRSRRAHAARAAACCCCCYLLPCRYMRVHFAAAFTFCRCTCAPAAHVLRAVDGFSFRARFAVHARSRARARAAAPPPPRARARARSGAGFAPRRVCRARVLVAFARTGRARRAGLPRRDTAALPFARARAAVRAFARVFARRRAPRTTACRTAPRAAHHVAARTRVVRAI